MMLWVLKYSVLHNIYYSTIELECILVESSQQSEHTDHKYK